MNKIIYESEIQLSNAINVSCYKIEVLREAVKKEANEIVKEALYDTIVAERNAIQSVLKWVTIN